MTGVDFRALFESAPGPFLVLTTDLVIVAVSDAYLAATMTTRETLIGRAMFDAFPDNPEDANATGVRNLRASLERVVRTARADTMPIQKYDIRRPRESGGGFEVRHWAPRNSPVLAADGSVRYVIHHVEDVTEFVGLRDRAHHEQLMLSEQLRDARAEIAAWEAVRVANRARDEVLEQLRASEHRFRSLVDSMPLVAWSAGADGSVDFFNRRWFEYTGIPLEDAQGWGWERAIHPDDRPDVHAEWMRAVVSNAEASAEFRLRGTDGAYRWFLAHVVPVRDEQGRVTRWFGTTTDIDDQRRVITERTRLFNLEQRARAEAEASSRAKDEFLAMVSHELRTPLNAILGYSTMLKMGAVAPERAAAAVERIERNARVQAQLIEDVLDVSRIVNGKLQVDSKPVEFAQVVESAIDAMRPVAEARNITIHTERLDAGATIWGDAQRLQQVAWNLVSNAVKFSPDGATVVVRLEKKERTASLVVLDHGKGIEPSFLPELFTPFRQADTSTTRRHGGLGLGLAIVRSLVQAMGGTVSAHSDGEGHGARFEVTMALAMHDDSRASVNAPVETIAPQLAPLTGVRVLGVDDEGSARDVLGEMLGACGASVTLASSADEAFEILVREGTDVLVSDIAMPSSDGYSLMRRVRTEAPPALRSIPAVALTAYASVDDRRTALAAGFDAHFSKPAEPVALSRLIARLVESGGARSQV